MSGSDQDRKPFGVLVRVCFGVIAVITIPPFVLLAVLPMLLLLAPVALVAIPFMVCAFVPIQERRTPVRRPVLREVRA